MRDALADLPAAPTDRATAAFVETCLETVAGPAAAAARRHGRRPHARRLLRVLAGKRHVLVTAHQHPDPDAIAAGMGMVRLLRAKLPDARVTLSIKGQIGGGINSAFAKLSDLDMAPWDEEKLSEYDAIVLLDTQPQSAYCSVPQSHPATAVIDHHRGADPKPKLPYVDIRTNVGATSSIIFSYFIELELQIDSSLAASLLYAIESDLAGAAGSPGELDNLALSSLTLLADTHKLYRMRYADLPQAYYVAYAAALNNAVQHHGPKYGCIISHLGTIDSMEKPAVMADFLLRLDTVQWSLLTAVHENRLVISLRTRCPDLSAVDVIRQITREVGKGGGHQLKAGGFADLKTGSADEVAKVHARLAKRLLTALQIKPGHGRPLVDGPLTQKLSVV